MLLSFKWHEAVAFLIKVAATFQYDEVGRMACISLHAKGRDYEVLIITKRMQQKNVI